VRLLGKPAFGATPKTWDNRTAISGEIPRFWFTNSDKGARYAQSGGSIGDGQTQRLNTSRNTTPPGWGGFFIGKAQTSFRI